MLLFILLACEMVDAPACVEGALHACPTVEAFHSCNDMLAYDGLMVAFTGGTAASYDATVIMDDVETTFRCDESGMTIGSGMVWSCGETGFMVAGHGDDVAVSVVLADGAEVTDTFAPCWDASEPNGRCCGWNFQATVELDLGG